MDNRSDQQTGRPSRKLLLSVDGLDSPGAFQKLKRSLQIHFGIERIENPKNSNRIVITFDVEKTDPKTIQNAILSHGYHLNISSL